MSTKAQRIATGALNTAIRAGKVQPPEACSACGAATHLHAHHEDYSRPLEVMWLCAKCHRAQHKEGRAGDNRELVPVGRTKALSLVNLGDDLDRAQFDAMASSLGVWMAQRRWAKATDQERKRQGALMAAGRRKARRHRKAKAAAAKAAKDSPR